MMLFFAVIEALNLEALSRSTIRDYYNRVEGPDWLRTLRDKPRRRCAQLCDPWGTVVEFGCGDGAWARELSSDVEYRGYDSSETMVERANERFVDRRRFRAQVADATQVRAPLADFVFSFYLLDLLSKEDAALVIDRAYECLRPGGKFGIVALTHGRKGAPKAIMESWERVYDVAPLLVGGCRPIPLLYPVLREDPRWKTLCFELWQNLIGSQVLVLQKVDDKKRRSSTWGRF